MASKTYIELRTNQFNVDVLAENLSFKVPHRSPLEEALDTVQTVVNKNPMKFASVPALFKIAKQRDKYDIVYLNEQLEGQNALTYSIDSMGKELIGRNEDGTMRGFFYPAERERGERNPLCSCVIL